jgi:TRAP-type C4-dicarboxylate transport system permease small subunit
MQSTNSTLRARLFSLARTVVTAWAILGGITLLFVVLINVFSVLGGIFWQPFPGDFELTEMGVALAVFSFLPYCQITGANVSADIFTSAAPKRLVAFLSLLASIVAIGFSLLLLWRMYFGMLDQKEYGYTTGILLIPHWPAFIPILISLVLVAVAAVVTLMEHFDTMKGAPPHG